MGKTESAERESKQTKQGEMLHFQSMRSSISPCCCWYGNVFAGSIQVFMEISSLLSLLGRMIPLKRLIGVEMSLPKPSS